MQHSHAKANTCGLLAGSIAVQSARGCCRIQRKPHFSRFAGLEELLLEGTELAALPELPCAPQLTRLSIRDSPQLSLTVNDVHAMCQRLPRLAELEVGQLFDVGPARTAGVPSSFVEAIVWLERTKPSLLIS